jgi:hypothetical protein
LAAALAAASLCFSIAAAFSAIFLLVSSRLIYLFRFECSPIYCPELYSFQVFEQLAVLFIQLVKLEKMKIQLSSTLSGFNILNSCFNGCHLCCRRNSHITIAVNSFWITSSNGSTNIPGLLHFVLQRRKRYA